MEKTLDAACISLLWGEDDYAEVERRAKECLSRHGTELVLALADLVTRVARVAATAENTVLELKGDTGVRLTPSDVVHAVVTETPYEGRFEVGGEEG